MINRNETAETIHSQTDEKLLILTKRAAQKEKQSTLELLQYLIQVDERRAYATLSCSSLFEYVVKVLGYSESQAAERVNSVRLMRTIPEVEDKIKEGSLSMTTASQVQRHLRQEKKAGNPLNQTETLELIESCVGQSKREVEKTLLSQTSQEAKIMQEKIREVTPELTELKFLVSESTFQKLNEVKNLVGNESIQIIFDQALDALIEKSKKKKGRATAHATSQVTESVPATLPAKEKSKKAKASSQERSRFISIHDKRFINQRAGDQCEHVDPITQIRCTSRYRLELDHIHPFTLGGSNAASNLRLLCRAHNLKAAMEAGLDVRPRPLS